MELRVVTNPDQWREFAGPHGNLEFAWGVTLDDGNVVVKKPAFAGIALDTFERVIAHELNHSFWVQNFSSELALWEPNWVLEGLANFVAPARELTSLQEAVKSYPDISEKVLEYKYRDLNGEEELVALYSIWREVVASLIPNGDASKLMQCLKCHRLNPTEEKFNHCFLQTFGISTKKHFQRMLQFSAA